MQQIYHVSARNQEKILVLEKLAAVTVTVLKVNVIAT
jgi:hypothetical protein